MVSFGSTEPAPPNGIRGSRTMRIAVLLVGLTFWIAGLTYSPEAHAQSGCSATYDATKSYCVPVVTQPWRWYWQFTGASHGPFLSESAMLAHAISFTLGQGSGVNWCTMALDHMTYDTTPSQYVTGVYNKYDHKAIFQTTQDKPHCSLTPHWTFDVTQQRTVGCPPALQGGQDWNLMSSAIFGAYCAIPWTEVFDRQPKLCKGFLRRSAQRQIPI